MASLTYIMLVKIYEHIAAKLTVLNLRLLHFFDQLDISFFDSQKCIALRTTARLYKR